VFSYVDYYYFLRSLTYVSIKDLKSLFGFDDEILLVFKPLGLTSFSVVI